MQIWRRFGSTALLGFFALGACDKGEGSASKQGEQASAQAAEGEQACTAYADKLCGKAGEQSPTCASVREVTTLMPEQACSAGLANVDVSLQKLDEMRKVCDELTTKLCNDIGSETQTCQMVKTKTANFPPEQCKQMLGQYDEVLAELKKMEERNKPLSAEQAEMIAKGPAPSFGPEDAKVTIVEFSDFQCPYCTKAATAVNEIKEKYGDKVRFVFRQFPLSFHQEAHLAAQASLAAHEQGKFWEYHDLLFQNQNALQRSDLEKYAEQVGLDMNKFKAALDEKKFADEVDAELEMGQKVSVEGTPTMFINGERVANPTDPAMISTQIEKALGSEPTKG